MTRHRKVFSLVILVLITLSNVGRADGKKITWLGWSDDIFEKAKKENRFVLLDLEAVWCHWCHVMDEKTYSDPKVIELINSHYLAVRVDQDSRPDLSNRYEDYGWPATIFFGPTGQELVKRAGNIPPEQMVSILQAIIDDPTPGPSIIAETKLDVAETGALGEDLRKELKLGFEEEYDTQFGGWGEGHKYLQADSVEWAIHEAANGNKKEKKRAQELLTKARVLLDPAWGGVYQYSAEGWNEPHFEKIMSLQTDNLRIYAQAFAQWKDQKNLKMAQSIRSYLKSFLSSPDGAFYTSQDADLVQGEHSAAFFKLSDKARRAKGIPRVDTHIYSRENGWAADALTFLSMMTGDSQPLDDARRAIAWIEANRAGSGGGFRHDSDDGGRWYLGDTLAMGQAYLRLYSATGDRKWLAKAGDAAKFISENFSFTGDNGKAGGFVTAKAKSALSFRPQRDENIGVARFANLLYQYTGDAHHKAVSDQAMRFLAIPEIAKRFPSAGVLLADWETGREPLHLTIVGGKQDPAAKALFDKAAQYPANYKRIEWWDKSEGPLPRMDVQYPAMPKAAAFICTSNRCSFPIFKPEGLHAQIDRVLASM